MSRKVVVLVNLKPASPAHHAVAVLLGNTFGALEQAFGSVRKLNPALRIQKRETLTHRRTVFGQNLTTLLELLVGDLRRGRAGEVRSQRQRTLETVGLNVRSKIRHSRVKNALGEVV